MTLYVIERSHLGKASSCSDWTMNAFDMFGSGVSSQSTLAARPEEFPSVVLSDTHLGGSALAGEQPGALRRGNAAT